MKFEKITRVRLPFDMRGPDPEKNYGIHCFDIFYILKGPKGAVQYAFNIRTFLPHVQEELDRKPSLFSSRKPIWGFDVGYHSPKPKYEGQTSMKCGLFESGECYYDGSSLRADKWTEEIFSTVGKRPEDVLWPMLEEMYREEFGK